MSTFQQGSWSCIKENPTGARAIYHLNVDKDNTPKNFEEEDQGKKMNEISTTLEDKGPDVPPMGNSDKKYTGS